LGVASIVPLSLELTAPSQLIFTAYTLSVASSSVTLT